MMEELGRLINGHSSRAGLPFWDHQKFHIRCVSFRVLINADATVTRCLAHVINLATQAVVSTYSKSKHYDPKDPEAHIPELDDQVRDEIGLIRAIVVKVCSPQSLLDEIHLTFYVGTIFGKTKREVQGDPVSGQISDGSSASSRYGCPLVFDVRHAESGRCSSKGMCQCASDSQLLSVLPSTPVH
jgi:hypothetical protein